MLGAQVSRGGLFVRGRVFVAVLVSTVGLAVGAFAPACARAADAPPRVPACYAAGGCPDFSFRGDVEPVTLTGGNDGVFSLSGPAPLQTTKPVACGDAGCLYNSLTWGVGPGGAIVSGCAPNTGTCKVEVQPGASTWTPVVVNQNGYAKAIFLLWAPPPVTVAGTTLNLPDSIDTTDLLEKIDVDVGCGASSVPKETAHADIGIDACLGRVTLPADWPAPPPNFLDFGPNDNALVDVLNELVKNEPPSFWPAPPPGFLDIGPSDNPLVDVLNDLSKGLPVTQAVGAYAADTIGAAVAKAVSDPADSTRLQDSDTNLAPDFPTSGTASSTGSNAVVSDRARVAARLRPRVVIDSVVASHPSHADVVEFARAIKLASASAYSPIRAEARLSLVAAAGIGEALLAHDLHQKSVRALFHAKLPAIASAERAVEFHRSARITLTPTPIGARVLRILEVWGLRHHVSLKLHVTERRSATSAAGTATSTIRVK